MTKASSQIAAGFSEGHHRHGGSGERAAAGLHLAAKAPKGANERIGVGFIGTGGRCQAHIDIVLALKARAAATPVAVCDIYGPRVQAAAQRTGGKIYRNYKDLLADPRVDVVCIATPDRHHAPQAIDAVRAGKDVYCEKPLTHWSQMDLAKQLGEEAAKHGRIVQVGTQYVADDAYAKARKLIKEGHRRQDRSRSGGLFPPRRLGRADADSRSQRQARPRSRLGAVPRRRAAGAVHVSRGSSSGGSTGTMPAGRPPTCWSTSSRPSSACWTSPSPSACWAAAAFSSTTAKCPTSATSSPITPAGRAWC